jgi:ribonuclease HI
LQFTAVTDKCSNNIAKYEAVLLGLCKLQAMGVQNCILKIYSNMITSWIEKECMARDATLEKYLAIVRRMESYFKGFTVEYVKRTKNRSR